MTVPPKLFWDVNWDDANIDHRTKSDSAHVSSKWTAVGTDTPLARQAVCLYSPCCTSLECMVMQKDWLCASVTNASSGQSNETTLQWPTHALALCSA
jgi:hypothetical protein